MPRRRKTTDSPKLSPYQKLVAQTAELIVNTVSQTTVDIMQNKTRNDGKVWQQMIDNTAQGIEMVNGRAQLEALEYLLKLDLCADSTLKINVEIGRLKRKLKVDDNPLQAKDGTPRAMVLG